MTQSELIIVVVFLVITYIIGLVLGYLSHDTIREYKEVKA